MAFHSIIGIDTGNNAFVIGGVDLVVRFPTLSKVRVSGSTTGIDGFYTVQTSTFNGSNTLVEVQETIPSASGDGLIQDGAYDIVYYSAPAIDSSKNPFIIPPLTLNTADSSLNLPGRQYDGYGEILNTNYVHLMENFAGPTAPSNPTTGQNWYDSSVGRLKFYEDSTTSWTNILSGKGNQSIDEGDLTVSKSASEVVISANYDAHNFYMYNNANVNGIYDSTHGNIIASAKSTGEINIRDGKFLVHDLGATITSTNESETRLEIGHGKTTNGSAYIDLVGDATYTDAGLRIVRGNTGPNAYSGLEHRGTGPLKFERYEAGEITFVVDGGHQQMSIGKNKVEIIKGTTISDATLSVINPSGGNSYGILTEFEITDTTAGSIDRPSISFITNENNTQRSWSVGFGSGGYSAPADDHFRVRESHTSQGGGTERFIVYTGSGGVGVSGFDVQLGYGDQTTRGNSGASRALVKVAGTLPQSKLHINFNGDFSGGTVVEGPSLTTPPLTANGNSTINGTLDVTGNLTAGSFNVGTFISGSAGGNNVTLAGNDGAIEITNTSGVPLIDFKNNNADDFDARIILNQITAGVNYGMTFIGTNNVRFAFDSTTIGTIFEISNAGVVSNLSITVPTSTSSQPFNGKLQFGTSDRMSIGDNSSFLHYHAIAGHRFYAGAGANDGSQTQQRLEVTNNGVRIGNISNTPIRQSNNISQMYAASCFGSVTNGNVPGNYPAGFNVVREAQGLYRIDHSIGTTGYAITITAHAATNSPYVMVDASYYDKGNTSIRVRIGDTGNGFALIDNPFDFIIMVH